MTWGSKHDLSFEVYTFGAPQVGNRAMVGAYNHGDGGRFALRQATSR